MKGKELVRFRWKRGARGSEAADSGAGTGLRGSSWMKLCSNECRAHSDPSAGTKPLLDG